MTTSPTGSSGVRQKSFTFKTGVEWTRGTTGVLSAEGKPSLTISAPPEFRGEPGAWTPEDLFVASVEVCLMSMFLSFARKRDLPLVSYRSHSNGVLESVDGGYRFTRVVIFPTITVSSSANETEVLTVLRDAERHCLVANSIASIVEVTPTIMVR
jgi:organic hydroperoxide reductase OsmC/OhrA